MALVTKLSTVKLVNPEGDRIPLLDATGTYGETIYTPSTTTEGEYVATTNETGYGAPNLTREQVANFPVGFLKKMRGDVAITFEPYSELTSSEWRAIVSEDGWYKFNLIGVPIVAYLTDIAIGDSGYLDGVIYTKLADGTTEVVTPDTLIGTKYSSASVNQLFIAKVSLKKSEIKEYLINLYKEGETINRPRITRAKQQFDVIRVLTTGAIYEYCRGNEYPAQEIVEYLNKYITDIRYGV